MATPPRNDSILGWLYLTSVVVIICYFIIRWMRPGHTLHPQLPLGPRRLPYFGTLFSMYRINAAPAKICNDLARRYGDLATLWLGSCPVIMINTPQAAHCLLQRKAASTSSRPMHNNFRHKIMPFRVVLEPEGETFRKLRQIYNKFLGKQHLQIFQKNQEEESESAYETVEWTKFLPNFSL